MATRNEVRRWMRGVFVYDGWRDMGVVDCGRVVCGRLAIAAAAEFGIDDTPGPLDDPEHWIWDEAADCAAWAERHIISAEV